MSDDFPSFTTREEVLRFVQEQGAQWERPLDKLGEMLAVYRQSIRSPTGYASCTVFRSSWDGTWVRTPWIQEEMPPTGIRPMFCHCGQHGGLQ